MSKLGNKGVQNLENQRLSILTGKSLTVQEEQGNIVRIFLSSTFHDFVNERNCLFNEAFPELEQWCQERGLEFQVADMRWGLRESAISDHGGVELCIKEIFKCQQASLGANFVAFVGDRYGNRPLPFCIPEPEFNVLLKHIDLPQERKLVQDWYLVDKNSVPPVYIFCSKGPTIGNTNELATSPTEKKEKQSVASSNSLKNERKASLPAVPKPKKKKSKGQLRASSEERKIASRKVSPTPTNPEEVKLLLKEIFQQAVQVAVRKKLIIEKNAQKYFTSVTEQEIWAGILTATEPEKHTFCFLRNFTPATLAPNQMTAKFVDPLPGLPDDTVERDPDAEALLENLKNFLMPMVLDSNNVFSYNIDFDQDLGINPVNQKHLEYLQDMRQRTVQMVRHMVTESLTSRQQLMSKDPLLKEVALHAQFCASMTEIYCSQDKLLDVVFQKLKDNAFRSPLILHGESGCGKTATVAKLIETATKRLSDKHVIIYRFLGTSPMSSSIHQVLLSLSQQIASVYNLEAPSKSQEDYNTLRTIFLAMLDQVSGHPSGRPLLLVLESLDQLAPAYSAYTMNWVPTTLPSRVNLLLSTMPNYQDLLAKLKAKLKPESFVGMTQLSNDNAAKLLKTLLEKNSRTLQPAQMKIVEKVLEQKLNPLLLRLTYAEASRWLSYTPDSELLLGTSIKEAIQVLFSRLEKDHGKMLVTMSLSYLVASRNGLTETEMEDILSLDDSVLDDVYEYWTPPSETEIRIPPMLWARMRGDMGEFIANRQADETTVMSLYHRQFTEVVVQRYFSAADSRKNLHKSLAEYFSGVWYDRPKPLTLSIKGKPPKLYDNAKRRCKNQPLVFGVGRYNLRKLNELPYHLHHGGLEAELIAQVLSNFGWLNAKLHASGMPAVIEDFDLYLKDKDRAEDSAPFQCIRNALRLIKPTLEFSGSEETFATEVLSRMLALKHMAPVAMLLDGAQRWCDDECSETILIPQNQYLMAPSGILVATLTGHAAGIRDISYHEDESLLVSASEDKTLIVYDTKAHTVTHVLEQQAICEALCVDQIADRFYALDISGGLSVYDMKAGALVTRVELFDLFQETTANKKTRKDYLATCDNEKRKGYLGLYGAGDEFLAVTLADCFFVFAKENLAQFQERFKASNGFFVRILHCSSEGLVVELGSNQLVVDTLNGEFNTITLGEAKSIAGATVVNSGGEKHLLIVYNNLQNKTLIQKRSLTNDSSVINTPVFDDCATAVTALKNQLLGVATVFEIACFDISGQKTQKPASRQFSAKLSAIITVVKFVETPEILIAVGCLDQTVRIFAVTTNNLKYMLPGIWGNPTIIDVHGVFVLTASHKAQYMKLWKLSETWCEETPTHAPSVAVTPSWICQQDVANFLVASVDADANIQFAGPTGFIPILLKYSTQDQSIIALHLLSDDKLLVVYGSGNITCFEGIARQKAKQSPIAQNIGQIVSCSINHDAQLLVALITKDHNSDAKDVICYCLKNKLEKPTFLKANLSDVVTVYALPDGVGLTSKTACEIQSLRGKLLLRLTEDVTCLAAKADVVAAALQPQAESKLTTIQIWELPSKRQKSVLEVASMQLTCMCFSDRDDFLFVGTGYDRMSVFMFDLKTGQKLRRTYMYAPVVSVRCNQDCLGLITGLGQLALLKIKPGLEVEKLRGAPIRGTPTPSIKSKSKMCSIL